MSRFRTIGVMGGMGPAATVDFMAKLLAASDAARDQDHPRILVDCDPTLPERHAAIRGEGPSPGPWLAEMARGLERAGAEVLCMPCNTAHAFEAEIASAISAIWVSIVESTSAEAVQRVANVQSVGLLAAQGTLDADLYERAMARWGVRTLRLAEADQAAFMSLLWRIKGGDAGAEVRAGMHRLGEALVADGAQAVIAACTEVPLVLGDGDLAVPVVDSSAALAQAVVAAARL